MTEALGKLVEAWLQSLHQARKSPRTIDGYTRDVRKALAWLEADLGRPVEMPDLTQEVLRRYLTSRQVHPNTENRYISALLSLMEFLVEERHLLPASPKLIRPKVPKRLPRSLTQQQAQQLMEAPREVTPTAEGAQRQRPYRGILRVRDAAVIEAFYATGVRPSDMQSMTTSGIEIRTADDGEPEVALRLIGKGNVERMVAARGPLIDLLKLYLERRDELKPQTDALFLGCRGEPLLRNGLRQIVGRWAQAVGLKVYPRMLRHSCAKHLVDQGVHLRYIQELLGHRSPATTAIYTAVCARELGTACAARHPRARAKVETPRVTESTEPVLLVKQALKLMWKAGRAAVASVAQAMAA